MTPRIKRTRRTIGAMAAVVASILIASCSSSASNSSGSTGSSSSPGQSAGGSSATSAAGATAGSKTLTIAIIADLTGPLVFTAGNPVVAASEAALQAQNAAGGVNGYTFAIKTYDTQTSSTGGVSAVRQALAAKPFAIISMSQFIGDAIDTLAASKVPVFGSGFLPNWVGPGRSNLFGLAGNLGTHNSTAQAMYCVANGRTKFAVLGGSQPAVATYQAELVQLAKMAGGTVVFSKLGIAGDSGSIQQAAQQVISSGANCVLSLLYPGTLQLQVDMNQLGGSVWVTDSADFGTSVEKQYGSAADGLAYFQWDAPIDDTANPGVAMYLNQMKQYQPNTDPRGQWAEAWEAGRYLIHTMGLVKGAMTQANVIAAGATVSNYTVDGMHGPISNPSFQDGTANELCGSFEVLTNGKFVAYTKAPANSQGLICGKQVTIGG